MKSFKKSFFVIFLFFLIFQHIFASNGSKTAELKGTSLCTYVFSYLENTGFNPQIQPLVSNGTNNLPYNIIVSFHAKDTKTDSNLILFFDIEDCADCIDIFPAIFDELSNKNYNCQVVFGYGNHINIPRDHLIYGAQVYAGSLNSTERNSVYIFKLNAAKNSIITGNSISHSPSWMLKDMFDAYSSVKLTEGLPLCFISQTQDYTFIKDLAFNAFAQAEIPCILAEIKDNSKIQGIILKCIDSYQKSQFEPSDSHTFMFRFFGKRIWFSEIRIINAMLVILILSLMLVFYMGFINKNLRKEFWHEISNNWYVIPVIFLLSVAGFFAGKGIYTATVLKSGADYTAFGFIIIQVSLSMLFVSAFFMLNLSLFKKYTTRSLDFILVVLTFANQFILSMQDISLFPIFMLIFIVSVISLLFRRNWIHIILLFFLIIPFIPYVNAIFRTSDTQSLNQMLLNSPGQPFLLSLILLPIYLMWLRILNAIKKRYPKKTIYALITASTYLFLLLMLIIINKVFYSNKDNTVQNVIITSRNNYDFELSYKDKNVFSDTIRTVNIKSSSIPVYACLTIKSNEQNTNSVLYSENDFVIDDSNSAVFSMPLYPPSELNFSYGCGSTNQTLIAEEIFYSEADNSYYSTVKTINTEGNE